MDGVSNEVFVGVASLVILLISTLYFALQQRAAAPAPAAQQANQVAPPRPAPPAPNAGEVAADRLRANQQQRPAADADDDEYIIVNLRIAEGAPIRHRVRRNSSIGELRHELFANEIASGVLVRLIYNGQLLQDRQTLSGLGVLNDSFIMCSLVVPEHDQHEGGAAQARREAILDRFGGWLHVWVICVFLLVSLWILCFSYPELFNNSTVVMLDGLTVGLTAWIVLTMRANQLPRDAHAPQ